MEYFLSKENQLMKRAAREFAQKVIAPAVQEMEENADYPEEVLRKMGEAGYCGLPVSREYGGAGVGYMAYVLVMEEIARVSTAMSVYFGGTTAVAHMINVNANHDLKQKYLAPLAKGEQMTSLGFTEPDTGVFPQGLKTKAEPKGDAYIVNGTKRFCSWSAYCDFALVFTRTSKKGLTAFIIERKTSAGWSNSPRFELMGRRGVQTFDLNLKNVEVPKENIVGKVDEGFPVMVSAGVSERLWVAAESVGIAQTAYEEAVKYAKGRIQWWTGKPISIHQSIQNRIADISAEIEAARSLVYAASRQADEGHDVYRESGLAKLFATRMASMVMDNAIHVHGPYGYTKDYTIERLYRDQKLSQLYGGPTDITRMLIAHDILK